jgi:hypothetical protein
VTTASNRRKRLLQELFNEVAPNGLPSTVEVSADMVCLYVEAIHTLTGGTVCASTTPQGTVWLTATGRSW